MASQIPESDVPKYEGLLKDSKSKMEALRAWKERPEDSAEFDQELQQALGFCKAAFGILRDDRKFERLATQLAEVIVEVRDYLGPDIMPLGKYHTFSRGIFEVNNKTVISGQYYQEIPFYGSPRPCGQDPSQIMEISKFYEWKVIDCLREKVTGGSVPVKCIYYLEKGDMDGVYYVLGYSAPGMHATIQLYQGEKPTFFQVEQRMIEALNGQADAVAASSHQ